MGKSGADRKGSCCWLSNSADFAVMLPASQQCVKGYEEEVKPFFLPIALLLLLRRYPPLYIVNSSGLQDLLEPMGKHIAVFLVSGKNKCI